MYKPYPLLPLSAVWFKMAMGRTRNDATLKSLFTTLSAYRPSSPPCPVPRAAIGTYSFPARARQLTSQYALSAIAGC